MSVDFFENGLCLHCHLTISELREYINFHANTEASWEQKDEYLQKKLDEILSKYPEEHHQDIVESYSWDLHLNQIKYPDIHRESLVLTIYSFYENQLNRLCAIFSESIESNIIINDLKGQGIERAFLYLKKVACIDFSGMGKELPYIKNVNRIRNLIVHNGSIIPEKPDKTIIKFITDNPHLYGESGRDLIIRSDFIDEFLRILINFFEKLDNEIQKYIKKYAEQKH